MTKLNRFTMPVFAGNAAQTQTSVFGTMKTSPQYTTDVAASIGTTAYGNGWADAIEIGYAPYMEDMNTLQRAITYQISYNQQQGIPEWDSSTEYYIGSLAKLNTANGSQVYSSLIDNNVGNLVSDATKWNLVFDTENSYVTTNTAQTITGDKTFTQNVVRAHKNITKGTNPSIKTYCAVELTDKNGEGTKNRVGIFESAIDTNGDIETLIGAYKYDNNSTTVEKISVIYPKTGNPYTFAPASDVAGSIVTTVNKSKASNGYFKLGNGMIVQWGKTGNLNNNASSPTSTTFTTPFTSSNYKVILTVDNGTTVNNEYGLYVVGKKTTAFTAIIRGYEGGAINKPAAYIAIGY